MEFIYFNIKIYNKYYYLKKIISFFKIIFKYKYFLKLLFDINFQNNNKTNIFYNIIIIYYKYINYLYFINFVFKYLFIKL